MNIHLKPHRFNMNARLKSSLVISSLVFALLLLPAVPSYAQDDPGLSPEELELLAFVQEALENMAALESLAIHAEQITDQRISSPALGDAEIRTYLSQLMDSQSSMNPDGETVASMGSLDQLSESTGLDGQTIEQAMIMEYVLLDGDFYVVVPNYEISTGGPNPFPSDWVNLTEDTSQFPGLELLDIGALTDFSSQLMPFGPLSETFVLSISEEASEESANGMPLRVFTLELDMQVAVEGGSLGEIFSEAFAESLGMDADTFIAQMLEGASMQQKIWIGADDQLPYRIEAVLSVDATINTPLLTDPIQLVQTNTTTQAFSAFNEPVTIEAPIAAAEE